MESNKVAVVVHSCDRYELLYKGFEYFFTKYWDMRIPATYYFATEEKTANVKGFKNIKTGKGQWSNRLVNIIDQIEEPYILYMQEDMWLCKPTSAAFFEQLFALTFSNAWQQVKLHSSEVYTTSPSTNFIDGFNVSVVDIGASKFLMSHQITLWDKAFLKQQLPPNEHPWRNERKGSKRLKKLNPVIMHVDYFSENGKPPINQNKPEAMPSLYKTISVNATLSNNAVPFIDEMLADPLYKQYAELLQHNYTHQLTHDGKPKPLKKDVFKRLKDWLRGK